MSKDSELAQREKGLKALANKRRLLLLTTLNHHKKLSVSELSESIRLSFSATSRHLNILYASDLVEREQRNLRVYYHIKKPMTPLLRVVISSL